MGTSANTLHREPWNKGKIVGQKAPFKLKDFGTYQPPLKHHSAGFIAQLLGDAGDNHLHQIFTSKNKKHLAVTLSA